MADIYAHRATSEVFDYLRMYDVLVNEKPCKDEHEYKEMQASYFAMLLLIPTVLLEPLINFYGGIQEVCNKYTTKTFFAKIFKVEVNLMSIRLAILQKNKEKTLERTNKF